RTNGFSEALSTINVSRDTHISVVDSKGRLLAHSIQAFAATNTVVDEEHSSATMNRGVVWAHSHGVVVLRAVERNRRTGFTVYAEYPRERVFAEIPNILFRTAILIAGATAIAMWVARVRAKALAEPAVKLAHSARSIAAGDLSVRVAESGVSEMREVGATFNTMAERLQRSHAQMEQEVADKTRDLANANVALEVASQHKSDFLAHMSHELRTPLNAVIGFSEMLKAQYFGPLNDKQAEYVRDINASGQHLLSLINDILDLAKVEAGRMELLRSDVHLPSLVEACCSLVSERFARKSQTLDAEVDPAVSFWSLDERKVKQCVLNLLSNANKFTPLGGRVALQVSVEAEALVLRVTDTGVGIAPGAVAQLFTEFYQVAPSSAAAGGAAAAQSTEAREGTGLGLSLTKKFVELHGGTVEVASDVGKGSTFTLRFPAFNAADADKAVAS
ncbi:MAG TPA: HAMP domain-containing sensor histidine kinase, partial [Casimicrobium sp.]|nr:HAMP domain-containing sensor histidine kinase [Casimicrobium sp.]